MNVNDQELEAKFYLGQLGEGGVVRLEARLRQAGAVVQAPRVRETNLRFDTPTGDLTRDKRVLRLRQDAQSLLTFKGPTQATGNISLRQEIEFAVSDFAAARRFLEALGYQVNVMYEKYRTTYTLDDVLVTLDEMPYGEFAEIEGDSVEAIQAAAGTLGLDWECRNAESYLYIFNRLRDRTGLSAQHLIFVELAGADFTSEDLGVCPALKG